MSANFFKIVIVWIIIVTQSIPLPRRFELPRVFSQTLGDKSQIASTLLSNLLWVGHGSR